MSESVSVGTTVGADLDVRLDHLEGAIPAVSVVLRARNLTHFVYAELAHTYLALPGLRAYTV